MTLWKWSQTAASNANSDATINWAENQAPSSVNDSARALMAAVAKARDDWAGSIDTGGSSTAFTISSNQSLTALTDGFCITARMHTANGTDPTLAVDGLTAKDIYSSDSTNVASAVLQEGGIYTFTYDSDDDVWYVHNFFGAFTFSDADFQVFDNSDNTKILALQCSGITTATTRTLTIPDANGTILLDGDIGTSVQAYDADLDSIAALDDSDGNFIVGNGSGWSAENGATARISLGAILTDGVFPGAIVAIIQDQKSAGTDGQALTAGADRTRELNTLIYNRNTAVSLSSDQFTLPAGTWLIKWRCQFKYNSAGDAQHQTILHNATDTSDVARGLTASVDQESGGVERGGSSSSGSAVTTIASPKAFEIRHRVDDTGTGGVALGVSTEVYTIVEIYAA